MKRGTIQHPKMMRLARALNVEIWGAVGIMESLWHFVAKYAIRGDIGQWTDEEIADAVGWTDSPQTLVAALVECHWLDEHPEHRLTVHDWHEHAEEAVKKTLKNRAEDFATFPEKSRKRRKISACLSHSHSHSQALPEPSQKPAAAVLPPSLDTPQFRSAWADWEQHRSEIKHPLKPTMAKKQIAKLEAMGHDRAIAAIQHSIAGGWQGIFEDKEQAGGNGQARAAPPHEAPGPAAVKAWLASKGEVAQ